MRKRLPNHATVAAYLALFIALGGGAYAAVKLPKNSVGSAQIKKNAVSSTKVKDHSLKAADFALGQLTAGPQGPKGDPGPKGDTGAAGTDGAPGAAGAPGSAVAYAHINSNGSLDAANSKNITAAISPSATAGEYCIQVAVPFTNVVATIDMASLDAGMISARPSVPPGFCTDLPSSNVQVRTRNAGGTLTDSAFYVIFN
jgi:hypothetical protein